MKIIVACCGVVLVSVWPCLLLANDNDRYRAQAGLFHSRLDSSTSSSRSTGLHATYHLDALPMRPADYPLGAEAFVERSASVSLQHSRASDKFDGSRTNTWSSGAGALFRRPDTPLYGEASYSYYDADRFRTPSGSELDFSGKSFQLAAGAYVARNSLLFVDWGRRESRSVTRLGPAAFAFETDTHTLGAGAQHLAWLPNGQHLAVFPHVGREKRKFSAGNEETNNMLSLDATYYPTQTLGLRGGLTYERGDSSFSEGETWRVGTTWFVIPTVVLLLDFSQFDARGAGSAHDLISLAAFVRF